MFVSDKKKKKRQESNLIDKNKKNRNYCPYHFDFNALHKSLEQWTIKCLTGNEVLMYLKTNKTKKFETERKKETNFYFLK